MPNPNLEQLIAAAALLRPMLGDLVFVGGAVTSLLVTEANGFARSDFPKTPKAHPCADGFIRERS
jgi:hypothetical protein